MNLEGSALPAIGTPDATWMELQRFAQCEQPPAEMCSRALSVADQWWHRLRSEAQALFTLDKAPDASTVEQWTRARGGFFEQWLATPAPVLVMEQGVFALHPDVGGVMMQWAKCADSADDFKVWSERTASSLE